MIRYILLVAMVASLSSVSEAQLLKRRRQARAQSEVQTQIEDQLQIQTIQGNCANGRCALPTTVEWAETVTTRKTAPRPTSNAPTVRTARYTTEQLRQLIQDAPEVPHVGVRGVSVYQHLVDPKHGFTPDQVNGLSSAEAYRLHSLAPTHADIIFPTYRVRETTVKAVPKQEEPQPKQEAEKKYKEVAIWTENTESPKSIWLVNTP